jgi:tetratricopeptide (TPR) repeat protein
MAVVGLAAVVVWARLHSWRRKAGSRPLAKRLINRRSVGCFCSNPPSSTSSVPPPSSDRAMAEFQEAIELNPSFAAAHAVLGAVLNSRGHSDEAVASVERGIRLSPSDPRLFIWLSGLAAAHYQLRHYAQAIEIGRRSWTLNHNYITGLTYVIAGLAQLGQIDEARATRATLKELDPNLVAVRMTLERVYTYQPGIDHLREGLCKAGFE